MPVLTEREIIRIDLEGRLQSIKAKAIERKTAAPTSETSSTSLIRDQLVELIADARADRIADVGTRASAFLLVLEAIRLKSDLTTLRAEFAEAATVSAGISKAKEIATDGVSGLVFLEIDKGLAKLFDALGSLKAGLDALAAVGVGGEDFEKARVALDKAIKAAEVKAQEKNKDKSKEK